MKVIHIALREFKSIFSTTMGWLVLCGFLFVTGVFWVIMLEGYVVQSTDYILNPYMASQLNLTDHLLLPFFGNLVVIILMIVPAISMRLFSEEYKQHSFELLLTSPVTMAEVVCGKFLGTMAFWGVMFLCTLYAPFSLTLLGTPDIGVFLGGYLALTLMAMALTSMGMYFSSLTENQVVALVCTFSAALVIYIAAWVGDDPSHWVRDVALATHLDSLMQGAVRLSDMVYFLGFSVFFLFATQQRLESFRWN